MIAPAEVDEASRSGAGLARPRLGVLVGVAALLMLVGIGAAARPGGAPVSSHLTSLAGFGDAIGATALVVAIGVFGLLAYALRPHRHHKSPDDYELEVIKYESNQTRWEAFLDWTRFAILAGAVLYGLFFVIQRITATPTGGGATRSPVGTSVTPTTVATGGPGSASSAPVSVGTWEVVAIVAGAAVLLVGLAWLFGQLRRPHLPFASHPGRLDPPLARVVDEALSDLLNDPDSRRAVIRAYAAMERLFARRGQPRRVEETPFEYVERSLEQAGAPRGAAIDLTELFERARFSDHVIDTSFRAGAIRALESVRAGTKVSA